MIPELQTRRLTLRPFTLDDIPALHTILQEPDILRYFPRPEAPPLERVDRMITFQIHNYATYHLGWWALVPAESGALIGWCGLEFLPETNEVEVGYLISHAWWGRGLVHEAATAALEYGFGSYGLQQIIALVHPENTRSIHVAETLGMQYVERATYFGLELNKYRREKPA